MKIRNTLIMLGVLIALAAFVYFYEIEGGKKREEKEKADKKIIQVEEPKVQEITLQSAEGEIHGRREGTGWKIIRPVETDGEEYEWNNMARTAAEIAYESRLEGEKELKNFGLETPRLKVKIKAGGSDQEILFGEDNPTQSGVYAKGPKSPDVLLIPSNQFQTFNKKLFDLRQKAALKFNQDEVQEITLRSPNGTYQFQKEGENWKIKSPIQAKADKGEISSLLSGFSGSVKEFIDKVDPATNTGLDPSIYEVALVIGKDRTLKRFKVGSLKSAGTPPAGSSDTDKKDDKAAAAKKEDKPEAKSFTDLPNDATFYAKDDSRPAVLVVDKYMVERLNKKLEDFRDKTILALDRAKLKKIEIMQGSETITLLKEGESDWLTPDKKKKAKSEQILAMLSAAEYNKAKRLLDPPLDMAATGLASPEIRVAFEQEGQPRQELLIGKDIEEGTYAKLADEPGAKVLEKDFKEKFKVKAADFLADNTPPKK